MAWHGDGAVENKEDTSSPTWSSLMASIGQQALLPKKPTGSSLIDRLFDTATGAGKQEKEPMALQEKEDAQPQQQVKDPTPKHAPGAFKPSAPPKAEEEEEENTNTVPDPKVKREKEDGEDSKATKRSKKDKDEKRAKEDTTTEEEEEEDTEKPKEEAKQPKLRPTVSEEEAAAFWAELGLDLSPTAHPHSPKEVPTLLQHMEDGGSASGAPNTPGAPGAGPKVEGGIDLATMKAGEAPEVKVGTLPASTASSASDEHPMEPEGEELKLDEEVSVLTGPLWPPNADTVDSFTENLHSILTEWRPSPTDMELVPPTYEDLSAAISLKCQGARTHTRLEMWAAIEYRHSEGARLMVKSCDPNEPLRRHRQAGSMVFACQLDTDFYPKKAMIFVAAYEYLLKAAVHFQIHHDLLRKWCRIAKAVLAD